jgi:uncharacterized membrane protein YgaE (UPF0421/DUF939 family)
MLKKLTNIRIGLRTIKTVAAVILSMILVDQFGTTTSRLIFAMLGAMAVVQPTFKESLESCMTQIVGVMFGAAAGILFMNMHLHPMVACGCGMLLVITAYNMLRIQFSPSLPCLIVVTLCTANDIAPVLYAAGRIWDTAIGLGVGMLINTLVFPYDNSKRIHATVLSLEKEVIRFLEDMFDGDGEIPNAAVMSAQIDELSKQLDIFANQKMLRDHIRRQKQLATFQVCADKARQLTAHMEVLCHMGHVGNLSKSTMKRLKNCGANIRDDHIRDAIQSADVVVNYHVAKILTLREELLQALETS